MHARLSAAGLLALDAADHHDAFTLGKIELPWFGAPNVVHVIFERDSEDQPPNESQIDAFCNFALKRDTFFETLEGRLLQYYNDLCRACTLNKSADDMRIKVVVDKQQLHALIGITGLLVSYFDGDSWNEYIGILMECSWDREHGLAVKVINGQITEIGSQDIII